MITKYCDLKTSSSSKLDLRINQVQLEDEDTYVCENQRGDGYDINVVVTGKNLWVERDRNIQSSFAILPPEFIPRLVSYREYSAGANSIF